MSTLRYHAVIGRDGEPVGLVTEAGPARGAFWDHAEHRWSARPNVVAALLRDPAGRLRAVDRVAAERIARDRLHAVLPSEADLRRLITHDRPSARAEAQPAPRGASLSNEDWLRATGWDLPYTELYQLWSHLGLRPDSPVAAKLAALREFTALPVWRAAPPRLRAEVEAFLRSAEAAP
ncbi:MAG TPA: hypothetical protein VK028_14365 [Micromonosporaceae bacterium]|nr:hypothetical protein [Micromonosporaceae bacterium]